MRTACFGIQKACDPTRTFHNFRTPNIVDRQINRRYPWYYWLLNCEAFWYDVSCNLEQDA